MRVRVSTNRGELADARQKQFASGLICKTARETHVFRLDFLAATAFNHNQKLRAAVAVAITISGVTDASRPSNPGLTSVAHATADDAD